MKVKIGDKIYTSKKQPIMVILTKKDKYNIAHMDTRATKYCEYSNSLSEEEVKKFMGCK